VPEEPVTAATAGAIYVAIIVEMCQDGLVSFVLKPQNIVSSPYFAPNPNPPLPLKVVSHETVS
jgi:hypothetical protein